MIRNYGHHFMLGSWGGQGGKDKKEKKKKKEDNTTNNSTNKKASREKKNKRKIKFPCKLCMKLRLTHYSPKMKEACKLIE